MQGLCDMVCRFLFYAQKSILIDFVFFIKKLWI